MSSSRREVPLSPAARLTAAARGALAAAEQLLADEFDR